MQKKVSHFSIVFLFQKEFEGSVIVNRIVSITHTQNYSPLTASDLKATDGNGITSHTYRESVTSNRESFFPITVRPAKPSCLNGPRPSPVTPPPPLLAGENRPVRPPSLQISQPELLFLKKKLRISRPSSGPPPFFLGSEPEHSFNPTFVKDGSWISLRESTGDVMLALF